ncbi:hypothetical protein ACLMJK_000959 [Lecanora helva]
MSRRISSRLASQQMTKQTSDKENNLKQVLSPSTTSAPLQNKAAPRKRAAPGKTLKTDAPSPPSRTNGTPQSPGDPAPTVRNSSRKGKTANIAAPSTNKSNKRKHDAATPKNEAEDDELPHNMGKPGSAKAKVKQEGDAAIQATPKRPTTTPKTAPKSITQEEIIADAREVVNDAQQPPKKRAKKAHPYGLTPGETPFPDWPHPTKEECQTVHDLLLSTIPPERQRRFFPPDDIPPPSEVVAGCGEVPSILDALIRTLLSAATNGQNSSNAFQGLVQRFGLAESGMGKGSVNWNAVHEASNQDVFDAIKCGGLAKNKSANIKKLLAMVHRENQVRLAELLKAKGSGNSDSIDKEEAAERELELRALQQGVLTLDYYHHLEKDDAITTFTSYPGIGVKTAACVNLFCMQRPCFAVDTHVFRLCQYLGWVPPEDSRTDKQKKVDRNTTFSHCEVMVPDELKYGLHQLFIEHGKKCPRCRAVTGEKSEGWADANCVIEHLVKRLGAKKGGVDSPMKNPAAKKRKIDQDSDDEASNVEMPSAESQDDDAPTAKKTPTRNQKVIKPAATAKSKQAGSDTKTKVAAAGSSKPTKGKATGRRKKVEADEAKEE